MRRSFLLSATKTIAAATLLACSVAVFAQNFPTKPLRLVVPYPAGGAIDFVARLIGERLSSVATAMQHVAAGKIVPLAMMGRERSTALPNVPTLRELGYTDPLYDASVWMAVLVPAKTPAAAVQKLSADIRAIANSPDVRKTLTDRGFEMMVTTPEQAQANYRAEFEVITRRIRELGIEAQ